MAGFWYLGTPFTKYPEGHEAAFRMACHQAALLLRAGIIVYSPIAHTYPIAIHGGFDVTHGVAWVTFDAPLMAAAHGIIICKMAGWDTSHGVTHERETFEAAGKPVVWMEPGVVPAELLR
jgi:Domain of unknown function (DUF1937)